MANEDTVRKIVDDLKKLGQGFALAQIDEIEGLKERQKALAQLAPSLAMIIVTCHDDPVLWFEIVESVLAMLIAEAVSGDEEEPPQGLIQDLCNSILQVYRDGLEDEVEAQLEIRRSIRAAKRT